MKQNIVRILIVGLILGSVFSSTIPMVSAKCDPATQVCNLVVKDWCDNHNCIFIEEPLWHWPPDPDCPKCGPKNLDYDELVINSIPIQVEAFAIR